MADLRDFTGKNRRFTGTDSISISSGTTAQRVNGTAKIRFNTTLNLMEYYDGANWKSIDSPPSVTGFTIDDIGGSAVTSGTIDNEASGVSTIEILGSLFDTTGAVVTFEGTAETISPVSTTRNSTSKITVTVTKSSFDASNAPYTIKVLNGSGLSGQLTGALSNDADAPAFTNAADTNFDIFDTSRGSVSIPAASLVEASPIKDSATAYTVQSGSLPSGLTLNGSSGVITGSTGGVGSDTVTTFTIRALSPEDGAADRQFTITQKAPIVTTFNSSGTFTVPTGLSTVNVLVVGGGGGTGARHAGGGGAGGLIYRPGFPITPGSPISVTVGGATPEGDAQGSDSVFSNLTAKGGGAGDNGNQGADGGSAAGGGHSQRNGGTATQPTQPGDSGTYGFGNPGGNGFYSSPPTGAQGGGGGGAGGAGGNSGPNSGSDGGIGKQYSISGSAVYYAGGGAGGNHQNATDGGNGGQGGGGNRPPGGSGTNGQPGTANRGGGAGGGNDINNNGSAGGSGVVIVEY